MPIYTRKGDKGETTLYGGEKVAKDHARLEACGSVDELNSFIGLALSEAEQRDVRDALKGIQSNLFELGADLACLGESNRINEKHVGGLEELIGNLEQELEPLHKFLLPRGTKLASQLQVCRAVCRRAERRTVALSKSENINPHCIIYLNRLSSLLFQLARVANKRAGVSEQEWLH